MTSAELAAIRERCENIRKVMEFAIDKRIIAYPVEDIEWLLALVARQQAVVEVAGQIKARVDAVGPVPSPAFWAEIAALVVQVNALTTYHIERSQPTTSTEVGR